MGIQRKEEKGEGVFFMYILYLCGLGEIKILSEVKELVYGICFF